MRDRIAAAVLFVVAASAGASYVRLFDRTHVRQDNFGQSEYAAPVAFACGRGFVDLGYDLTPSLRDFLLVKRDDVPCAGLPRLVPARPPNFTQGLHRYLMTTVGLVWRLRGRVSWAGLWPLFGVMYGCTVVAAFLFFRAIVSRPWAIAAASAVLLSTIHLTHLPYLRDYAIAPFVIGSLALIVRISAPAIPPRRLVMLAAAFGLLLGIGLGFRNDIGVVVPPFIVALLCARPAATRWSAIAGAFAVAASVFLVSSLPVLTAYGRGSNSGHVALLGFMSPFDAPLGIRAAPYDWGYVNDDSFVADVMGEYRTRVAGHADEFLSRDYDRATMDYLLLIARHWPADVLSRALAAAIRVLNMPFTLSTYAPASPDGATSPLVAAIYRWQNLILRVFTGRGVLIMLLALTLLSLESVPVAVGALLLVIYYAGYPAIQFHVRHFFYLEFLSWAALALAYDRLLGRSFWRRESWRPALVRAATFLAAAALIVAGSVTVARAYQEPHVRAIVRRYLDAPTRPVTGAVATPAYLVAEFSPPACDAISLPATLRYPTAGSRAVFTTTRRVRLVPGREPTYLLFPAYAGFSGLELPSAYSACLTRLARVTDFSSVGALLDLSLEPGWDRLRFAQTIASIERDDADRRRLPRIVVSPADLVVTRRALSDPVSDVAAEAARTAPIVSRGEGGEWRARGRPDIPAFELLSLRGRTVSGDDVFIAQGVSGRGGVSIAILDADRRVAGRVAVTEPGPFLATLGVPAAGRYSVEIHTQIDPWWPASHIGRRLGPLVGWMPFVTLREDVTFSRLGWLLRR